MKQILLFIILVLSLISASHADPNVLQCKQNCGTYDSQNSYSFQARMAQGEDMWGANVTFIEDDIIISSAHILGFEPNRKADFIMWTRGGKNKEHRLEPA